jgi:hypothetical protein
MHTVHNARIQLLATAFNNLALAVIVASFIAPAITFQLRAGGQLLVTFAWVAFGIALHLFGQTVLGRLRQ